MNNVIGVCVFECSADLRRDLDDAREIRWPRLRETWTRNKFHYQKRLSTFFADVVNGDDVRMIERCGRARFANQTIACV
jgi:very-short-patch-repair endonuclease